MNFLIRETVVFEKQRIGLIELRKTLEWPESPDLGHPPWSIQTIQFSVLELYLDFLDEDENREADVMS